MPGGKTSADLAEDIAAFRAATPKLSIWERWPDVTEDEDSFTDQWACEAVTREFVAFLQTRGWTNARAIRGDTSLDADCDYHVWARVGSTDIDWTARQFENLEHPRNPDHANIDCPLVWQHTKPDVHPVVGTFLSLRFEEDINESDNRIAG